MKNMEGKAIARRLAPPPGTAPCPQDGPGASVRFLGVNPHPGGRTDTVDRPDPATVVVTGVAEAAPPRQVRVPSYLPRFRCLGSACEDTCCAAGWAIAIDARTLGRYQSLDHQLGPDLRAAFIPNAADQATAEDSARIQLNDQGQCPFLTADSLCRVQLSLGEDYLSTVCAIYPRFSLLIADHLERAAMLSCPEVTRLALLDPGAMDSVIITDGPGSREIVTGIGTSEFWPSTDAQRAAAAIRQESVALLRERGVALDARLLALGLALQRLGRRQRPRISDIENVFSSYVASLPEVEAALRNLPTERTIQLELLRELIVERNAIGGRLRSRYAGCVDRAASGLRLHPARPVDGDTERRYRTTFDRLYAPYLRQKPYVLENLLVNQIYTSAFPFGRSFRPFDDYILMVVRYALVRLLLVGVAATEDRLDDMLVVEVVESFERAFSHAPSFLQRLLDILQKSRAATMDMLAMVIGNDESAGEGKEV